MKKAKSRDFLVFIFECVRMMPKLQAVSSGNGRVWMMPGYFGSWESAGTHSPGFLIFGFWAENTISLVKSSIFFATEDSKIGSQCFDKQIK